MRKSFFRFSLRSPPTPTPEEATPTSLRDIDEVSLPSDPEARYIPRQWAPNRYQTLYVTPSERNLYLAAMAQLDQAPPPLPLWTDPAPVLPVVRHQTPLDPTPPSVKSPPKNFARFPPATGSKFVTSPGMPLQGLSIREEFRAAPRGSTEGRSDAHALLALSDDSQLRFHNFPVDVLVAAEETLNEAWPRGRRSAHPELVDLMRKSKGRQEGNTWIVVLKGKVWRQAGNSELDSIRLILALLTTLSVHGWTLVDRMQAAGVKYDNHNLLFAHSADIQATPPVYFALSIPLPDRISLISPPPKATPSIISAVRQAIDSQTATSKKKARRGVHKVGDRTSVVSTVGSKSVVEWDAWKGNIRVEGWIHAGVYRFWLDGMRRWLGNGVKWRVVEKLHPGLMLTLINSLSAQHFSLLTSLPLLPLVKGRDILIFASQPSSGLTYLDAWKSQPDSSPDMTRAESLVLVNPSDAIVQPGQTVPAELQNMPVSPVAAREEAAGAMMEERRQAAGVPPKGSSGQNSPIRMRDPSDQSSPTRRTDSRQHQRTGSADDTPLSPEIAFASRQRNILVKMPSLSRDGKTSQSHSRSNSLRRGQDVPPSAHQRFASLDERRQVTRPDAVNITSRHGIGSEHSVAPAVNDGEWTMVDPPGQSGLGLSMYAPLAAAEDTTVSVPPTTQETTTPAWNEVETAMPPPLPARPTQPYTVPQPIITLFNPLTHQPDSSHSYIPSHAPPDLPARSKKSFESDRSIYVDAPTNPSNPHQVSYYTPLANGSANSETYDQYRQRDLTIANPTPPPMTTSPYGQNQGIMATLDIPLSQPTSPMRGRDAIVDVGPGTGAESVRGSVGYMPSLASQSMLGLSQPISEGPILGAWDEIKASVPMPMPMPMPMPNNRNDQEEVKEEIVDRKGKGKEKQGMRNMFGFKHSTTAGENNGSVTQRTGNEDFKASPSGAGAGSARTKISMGT